MDKVYEIRERKCSICSEVKTIDNFYRDKFQSTGYKYNCKSCECEFKKTKRKIDPNHSREIVRRSYARDHVKKAASERNKRYRAANYKKVRERERRQAQSEHSKVRRTFMNAIKEGKIIRPDTCEDCGANTFVEGHHFDYSKPLEVKWLCRTCHGKVHRIS
jgi:hypothetical protein